MLSKFELELLRPWVSGRITALLGGFNPTVVNTVLECIAKSLNRQATTEKLRTYLEHETASFVENLYRKVLEVKSANIATGSSIQGIKRAFESAEAAANAPATKKSRFGPAETKGGSMSHAEIEAVLQLTIKDIEEKRSQTKSFLPKANSAGILPTPKAIAIPASQIPIVSSAVEKAKRAAELQAKISNTLASKPGLLASVTEKMALNKPVPLVLDSEGKSDIPTATRAPTLMANVRAQQKAQVKQISREQPKREERPERNPYFDQRVTPQVGGRGRKQFKFNDPGKYVKLGQTIRTKAKLEKLQSEIASSARKTGISSATKLALIAPTTEEREDDIPLVEWWDADLLPSRAYEDYDRVLPLEQKYREITNLIEHPLPIEPAGQPNKPILPPVILTKNERKKIRKQRRREVELEKQEKIRFGFMDKPEPKLRISNMMRVLATDAIQDPTKITAQVKAQMAERQRIHEEANAARMLTPEQRRAKKLQKMQEDTSTGVHITVYRIKDLSNHSNKFKVDINAQQYHLTGCVLVYPNVNLVVVEGGPKAQKKYKKLMLHRIKWNPENIGDDDESDSEKNSNANSCTVVWEGIRSTRHFYDWRFKQCPSETIAREHLKKHGAEHYWDMALSLSIVDQDKE